MSAEITPAIARAAEANYLSRAGFRDDSREMYRASGEAVLQSWADATRPVVAAALDVEEMARAFVAPTPWGDLSDAVKSEYLLRMRHVRDAITGGAS